MIKMPTSYKYMNDKLTLSKIDLPWHSSILGLSKSHLQVKKFGLVWMPASTSMCPVGHFVIITWNLVCMGCMSNMWHGMCDGSYIWFRRHFSLTWVITVSMTTSYCSPSAAAMCSATAASLVVNPPSITTFMGTTSGLNTRSSSSYRGIKWVATSFKTEQHHISDTN